MFPLFKIKVRYGFVLREKTSVVLSEDKEKQGYSLPEVLLLKSWLLLGI